MTAAGPLLGKNAYIQVYSNGEMLDQLLGKIVAVGCRDEDGFWLLILKPDGTLTERGPNAGLRVSE